MGPSGSVRRWLSTKFPHRPAGVTLVNIRPIPSDDILSALSLVDPRRELCGKYTRLRKSPGRAPLLSRLLSVSSGRIVDRRIIVLVNLPPRRGINFHFVRQAASTRVHRYANLHLSPRLRGRFYFTVPAGARKAEEATDRKIRAQRRTERRVFIFAVI